ncbi:MAG: hypothetical protein ACYCV7_04055, partial [Acidimicrobiales bacterium]
EVSRADRRSPIQPGAGPKTRKHRRQATKEVSRADRRSPLQPGAGSKTREHRRRAMKEANRAERLPPPLSMIGETLMIGEPVLLPMPSSWEPPVPAVLSSNGVAADVGAD